MRRSALLGTLVLPGLLLLGGCSGLGRFLGDTFSLPGTNPDLPYGVSETGRRARGLAADQPPILPEPGNIWPGPPQPLPTLSDVSRSTGSQFGAQGSGSQGLGPQDGGGRSLRNGDSMSVGEQDRIARGVTPGDDGFSGTGSEADRAPDRAPHAAAPRPGKSPAGGKSIVIPNGDGTFTVIGPDGSVNTVNSAPK